MKTLLNRKNMPAGDHAKDKKEKKSDGDSDKKPAPNSGGEPHKGHDKT